jgi:hypothetical protein
MELRTELLVEAGRWQAARPRVVGPTHRLKRISVKINRELGKLSRLIDLAEDHWRQRRWLFTLWTRVRIFAKKQQVRILTRRIERKAA